MTNAPISNPNDFKVIDFTNKTDFDFTPEMGCMFDSRPIFGISGANGVKSGESIKLPYHIGHRIAVNLAKVKMMKSAPTDAAGIPTGVPIWTPEAIEALKDSYITDLYTEQRPIAETEVDRLMKKVEELNKLVHSSIVQPQTISTANVEKDNSEVITYKDKQDVMAALEKKGIKFDARASRSDLEKLLA